MHNVMSEEIMLITIPHVCLIFNNEKVPDTRRSHLVVSDLNASIIDELLNFKYTITILSPTGIEKF